MRISVYDVLGKEIAVLVNEKQQAGKLNGMEVITQAGVYFYKLSIYSSGHSKWSDEWTQTKKMVLIK